MPPTFAIPSERPYVLLEDRLNPKADALLYAQPVEFVQCERPEDVAAALEAIEAGLARGLHAAGFASYELGYGLNERLRSALPRDRAVPLLWFGLFEAPESIPADVLDHVFGSLPPPQPLENVRPCLDSSAHGEQVARILDYLRDGDAYQVNLTFPVDFSYDDDPVTLYAALRTGQPVSHGGIVSFGGATILSVSPELFIQIEDGVITTRPMKGTVMRGATPGLDQNAIAELTSDPKQRAENLMIVDLLRNDIARISEIGSVKVPELFKVETYPTLHTLTSTVTARLKPATTLDGLFQAIFPCGSITGAPKLRAMEIIRELEALPRDVYTGAIGAISPTRDLRFNVAIRTATVFPDGSGRYGVGGGIVADSKPAAEYEECLLKARVLMDLAEDYGLIETLLWSPECGFGRRDLHLDRLERSASALAFALDRDTVEARLDALGSSFDDGAAHRVRIELRRDGRLEVIGPKLAAEPDRPVVIAVASKRADAGDPFLRHKTTRRALYEGAFAEATQGGADEAILLNRSGYLTEATRSNIFVERDGVLLTPPVRDGLLPGILRQSLLAEGRAVEHRLTLKDLRGADRWYVGNSLRGLREARLAEGADTSP
jgi:para-aminobenzoate synthetase/4-amino-4-deoxychorismate lyase